MYEREAPERRNFSADEVTDVAGSCCRPSVVQALLVGLVPRTLVGVTRVTQTPLSDDHGAVVDHMEWVHADYELRVTPVATAEL